MNEQQPVFIFGCPRSGTTLLTSLLTHLFNFAIPVETHFIPIFRQSLYLWGDLSKTRNRERIVNAIFEFLQIWTPRVMRGREPTEYFPFSLCVIRHKASEIVSRSHDYPSIVDEIFRCFAAYHSAAGWGDKSALYYPLSPHDTLDGLADAKVIHIVRNPFDVVASWMRTWTPPATPREGACLWREHQQLIHDWGRIHPDRYLLIRYEDMVTSAPNALEKLKAFLGTEEIADIQSLQDNPRVQVFSKGDTHRLLAAGITAKSIGAGQRTLSSSQIAMIGEICGDMMETFQYARSSAVPAPQLLESLAGAVGYLRFEHMIRRLKPALPHAIRSFDLVGLSLSKVLNSGNSFSCWRSVNHDYEATAHPRL